MYFYELHEGDEEVFSDVLLVHPEEISPEDFYDLVQEARRRVQEDFEQDTLIEAIAEELERDHGFTYISDGRLTAAVNVSTDDDENYLATVEEADDSFDDEEGDDDSDLPDYRAIIADFQPDAGHRN